MKLPYIENDYIEAPIFFCTCQHCQWEDDTAYGCEEDAQLSECPECGSEDILITKDWA